MREEILIKEIDDLIEELDITTTKEEQHVNYYFFVNIAVKVEIEKIKFPDNTMSVASLMVALFAILISCISIMDKFPEEAESFIVGCAIFAMLLIVSLIGIFKKNEKKNKVKMEKLIFLQELLNSYLKK